MIGQFFLGVCNECERTGRTETSSGKMELYEKVVDVTTRVEVSGEGLTVCRLGLPGVKGKFSVTVVNETPHPGEQHKQLYLSSQQQQQQQQQPQQQQQQGSTSEGDGTSNDQNDQSEELSSPYLARSFSWKKPAVKVLVSLYKCDVLGNPVAGSSALFKKNFSVNNDTKKDVDNKKARSVLAVVVQPSSATQALFKKYQQNIQLAKEKNDNLVNVLDLIVARLRIKLAGPVAPDKVIDLMDLADDDEDEEEDDDDDEEEGDDDDNDNDDDDNGNNDDEKEDNDKGNDQDEGDKAKNNDNGNDVNRPTPVQVPPLVEDHSSHSPPPSPSPSPSFPTPTITPQQQAHSEPSLTLHQNNEVMNSNNTNANINSREVNSLPTQQIQNRESRRKSSDMNHVSMNNSPASKGSGPVTVPPETEEGQGGDFGGSDSSSSVEVLEVSEMDRKQHSEFVSGALSDELHEIERIKVECDQARLKYVKKLRTSKCALMTTNRNLRSLLNGFEHLDDNDIEAHSQKRDETREKVSNIMSWVDACIAATSGMGMGINMNPTISK